MTPRRPATVRLVRDILEQAAHFYSVIFIGEDGQVDQWSEIEQLFNNAIRVYNSYWRDDPVFDCTNTLAALPYLPCPHVDREMLMRMALTAIDTNFGGARKRPVEPEFDPHKHLEPLIQAVQGNSDNGDSLHLLGLQITGHGGGDWHLMLRDGALIGIGVGRDQRCTATYYTDVDTFASLVLGQQTTDQAVKSGRLVVEANGFSGRELMTIWGQVIDGPDSTFEA